MLIDNLHIIAYDDDITIGFLAAEHVQLQQYVLVALDISPLVSFFFFLSCLCHSVQTATSFLCLGFYFSCRQIPPLPRELTTATEGEVMVELTGHAVIQKIDNLYSEFKIEIERLAEEKNALCAELKDKKNELDSLRQSLADESKAMGEEITEHTSPSS